jgi:hypothetical protein
MDICPKIFVTGKEILTGPLNWRSEVLASFVKKQKLTDNKKFYQKKLLKIRFPDSNDKASRQIFQKKVTSMHLSRLGKNAHDLWLLVI